MCVCRRRGRGRHRRRGWAGVARDACAGGRPRPRLRVYARRPHRLRGNHRRSVREPRRRAVAPRRRHSGAGRARLRGRRRGGVEPGRVRRGVGEGVQDNRRCAALAPREVRDQPRVHLRHRRRCRIAQRRLRLGHRRRRLPDRRRWDTWQFRSGYGASSSPQRLAVDPESPNVVFAAGVEGFSISTDGGVKTTNGADSWRDIGKSLGNAEVGALAVDPARRAIVYAGASKHFDDSDPRGPGAFVSPNGGRTWTRIDKGLRPARRQPADGRAPRRSDPRTCAGMGTRLRGRRVTALRGRDRPRLRPRLSAALRTRTEDAGRRALAVPRPRRLSRALVNLA